MLFDLVSRTMAIWADLDNQTREELIEALATEGVTVVNGHWLLNGQQIN